MAFIYHKPGIGSWASFEEGLPEYKEAQLRVEWWYGVSADKPYTTKRQRRRDRAQAAAAAAGGGVGTKLLATKPTKGKKEPAYKTS